MNPSMQHRLIDIDDNNRILYYIQIFFIIAPLQQTNLKL